MTLTKKELRDIEEALEECQRLYRDGMVHGPGAHWPEYVFTDLVPMALALVSQELKLQP